MESKIGLVLMIGLPGCGKSTLVNNLSQHFRMVWKNESEYKIHHVIYDEMIPVSVQCGSGLVSWREARDKVLEQVKSRVRRIRDLGNKQLSSKTLIIIDDNMYYRSMRYEYFQIARMFSLSFCQLYVCETVDIVVERNNRRISHMVPEEVIRRMATRIQPPDPLHNTWERFSLTVSSENTKLEEISQFLTTSLEHVVQPIPKPAQTAEPSVIHRADLELRKFIGQIMREERGDGEFMRSKAAALNVKRNEVLDRLRAGDISFSEEVMPAFLAQQLGLDDHDI